MLKISKKNIERMISVILQAMWKLQRMPIGLVMSVSSLLGNIDR